MATVPEMRFPSFPRRARTGTGRHPWARGGESLTTAGLSLLWGFFREKSSAHGHTQFAFYEPTDSSGRSSSSRDVGDGTGVRVERETPHAAFFLHGHWACL